MRIDKWLWAARFFKTRGLAQVADAGGKVKLHGERVKPAKEVGVGDELSIRIGEYAWVITLKGLSERRGPAAVAVTLYEESEESRARRMAQIADRRAHGSVAGERKGRPKSPGPSLEISVFISNVYTIKRPRAVCTLASRAICSKASIHALAGDPRALAAA